MILVLYGIGIAVFVVFVLGLIWTLGNPTKGFIAISLLVSGLSIANSLGIHPLAVPLVLLVGYLAAPLVSGFVSGYAGEDRPPSIPKR